ncbi:VOC family protein [Alkalicoccobacillus gibsonii]|uniref:VOC family protein n=1 Tax=Alkalicoccobacillus gibsonii TaxID=79881 RepID=UPI0019322926|nr:VOC family protein [Alkalicoccobacillus gibsonii]MBM0066752.1 hypothetical protein [Alkalicoccobacillus gibsonii]
MKMIHAIPRLPVSNINQSCDFYKRTLNFTLIHADTDYAIVSSGKVELHLFRWTPVDGVEQLIANSCRIEVKGIDKLYKQLEIHNVIHPNGKLSNKDWGEKSFTMIDLDNNAIDFYETI